MAIQVQIKKISDYPGLGIRPFLYEGETLSSYLHRVADVNKVSYKDLVKVLTQEQKLRTSRKLYSYSSNMGYRIDILPIVNYNISALSQFINKSEREILEHSLFSLYQKLYDGDKSRIKFLIMSTDIYKTKERYFCPLCIKNNKGVFIMKWQFSGVSICEEHKCLLVNRCKKCKGIQKYIHTGIGEGLCSECNEILNGEYIPITDQNQLSESFSYLNDFYFLLEQGAELNLIKGIDKKSSTVIALFYVIQKKLQKDSLEKIEFNINNILSIIKRDYINKLMRFLGGMEESGVYFPTLISFLRKINMNLVAFSKVKVPSDYIETIYDYIKRTPPRLRDKPFCKFKFCPYFNKNNMYNQVKEKVVINNTVYTSPKICKGCFIQYGFNIKSNTWQSINDIITLSIQIRDFLKRGISITDIAKQTSCSKNRVYYVIGFLLRHSLLDNKSYEKYMQKVSPYEEVKKIFEELKGRQGDKLISIRKYSVHPVNFYFHFFSNEVQENLFINNKRNYNLSNGDLMFKANKFIEDCLETGKSITIQSFCRKYKVSKEKLKKLGVSEFIILAKEKQNIDTKLKRERLLLDKTKYFFETNPNGIFSLKKVCESIGISEREVHSKFPNVYWKISDLCNERRDIVFKDKVGNLKIQVKKLIEKEIEINGKFPSISKISKELEISSSGLYNKYQEVYLYIMEIRESVKSQI